MCSSRRDRRTPAGLPPRLKPPKSLAAQLIKTEGNGHPYHPLPLPLSGASHFKYSPPKLEEQKGAAGSLVHILLKQIIYSKMSILAANTDACLRGFTLI